jgi:two-component system response regulator YesN
MINQWKKHRGLFRLNRRSVLITLLVSYVLILLIPVTIGIVVNARIVAILEENTNRYNMAMLQQLSQNVESRIREVNQLNLQISLNPKLQLLLNDNQSFSQPTVYQFIEFMDDLSRYRNISNFIYDFYVYFSEHDVVLTPQMKTDSRMFYNYIYHYKNVPFEVYKDTMLRGYHNKAVFPSAPFNTGSGLRNMITYVQSLPFGERNNASGYLVILIDDQKIKDMLDKNEKMDQSYIYIVNSKNKVIMSTRNDLPSAANIFPKLTDQQGNTEYKLNGKDMMISYTTSNISEWKYIAVLPKDVFLEKVNQVKSWALYVLLFCLAGGIIAAYIMAYRNYSTVREVVNVLLQGKKNESKKVSNEFDFIKESILHKVAQEENLRDILSQQAPIIKANLLARLVKGHIDKESIQENMIEFMDIRFISDDFAVLLIDIEDFSGFTSDRSERQWVFIRFIISNLCSDLMDEHWGYTVEIDKDRLAVLINLETDRLDKYESDLSQIASNLMNMMNAKFKTTLTVAVSNAHSGLDAIGECYREALEALDYKIIKGSDSVIFYNEIKGAVNQQYYYPLDLEIQLINFVKNGDFDNVEGILDQMYIINFENHQLTPELGKCLFFNLISTQLKILNSTSILYKDIFPGKTDPMKQLEECSTAKGMHQKVKRSFQTICDYMREKRTDYSSQLLAAIIRYTESHYADDALSLTSIADHFNITPPYLSGFFKKHNGENITDFISKIRVEKAKQLMHDHSITIAQIAQSVGYANDSALIRAFKKYEGITPGKYKSILNS